MKRIEFDEVFIKNYKIRVLPDSKLSRRFDERLALFSQGKTGPPLNDHALKSSMKGMRAFSITGDIRVVYDDAKQSIVFRDIGTHQQVYRK